MDYKCSETNECQSVPTTAVGHVDIIAQFTRKKKLAKSPFQTCFESNENVELLEMQAATI